MNIKLIFVFGLFALQFFAGVKNEDHILTSKETADAIVVPFATSLHPKRELRAAWITTFTNLDWPSKKGLPEAEQKAEFIRLLDELQMNNINCVVVQIRAAGDAFYASKFAPWSEYLMGKQGLAPNYDPLSFMIAQCHQRNIEFHAWLNPYRAVSSIQFSSVSDNNIYKKHPEWFFKYGGTVYFNPGIKQVRQHILSIVGEIVNNYDVDAIHFDDYFYPYSIEGEKIGDAESYQKHSEQFPSIHDWRRNNINELIRETAALIKFAKPYVKFGVSPLAFWRNSNQDAAGSQTESAQTSYDNLYCDTRKWLHKGWIDYVAPQLYWSRKSTFASYSNLLNWWTSHDYKGHIYIGQALFRLEDDAKLHFGVSEVLEQIKLNRLEESVNGNVFFRAKTFRNNVQNIQDSLQNSLYKYPSLIPAMKWIDSIPPLAPECLQLKSSNEGVLLQWKPAQSSDENNKAHYYVVYRFLQTEQPNLNSAKNIVALVKNSMFFDKSATENKYKYVVTSVDRLHNESVSGALSE